MKISTKIRRKLVREWACWKLIVDWAKANSIYIIAILFVLNRFGMIAPETATALRDALVGFLVT